MSKAGSLDGFRVIELTQGLCGPFCTMQLGDAGAEVIKIEPPAGDFARRMGPPFIGHESAVFLPDRFDAGGTGAPGRLIEVRLVFP